MMRFQQARWVAALALAAALGGRELAMAQDALRVIRNGSDVYIRGPFAPGKDWLAGLNRGTNGQVNFCHAYVVPGDMPLTAAAPAAALMVHGNGDDSTPWLLNGTYIGGNHGCASVIELTAANHGRTPADLGTPWNDAKGETFYLIKILDSGKLWFLPPNKGKGPIWNFNTTHAGPAFTRAADGATIPFTGSRIAQLVPAVRLATQQYLADGRTPLPEGQVVACARLDVLEEYDIINPGSLLADLIAHPGEERNFAAPHLEGVVRNRILYRFYPNGSNVIETNSTALQDFSLSYMGFVQSARLLPGKDVTLEYFIPKTLPFIAKEQTYNFRDIADYSAPPPAPFLFEAKAGNIEDPANLPERFIQFRGHRDGERTVRDVGYALGYSLVSGVTRPEERAKNAAVAAMLYTSSKSYPRAIDSKMGPVKAGMEFRCVAYRTYFNPAACPNATAVYWYPEGDSVVLYAHYHKSIARDTLALPAALQGKRVRVVEQTPSVALLSGDTVPAEGLALAVRDGYGHIVLELR